MRDTCNFFVMCSLEDLFLTTVLASNPCTRRLDGYKVKMTGKNCPNYTIKEEVHGQLYKNWEKTRAVV